MRDTVRPDASFTIAGFELIPDLNLCFFWTPRYYYYMRHLYQIPLDCTANRTGNNTYHSCMSMLHTYICKRMPL